MGTPEFAVPSLDYLLLNQYQVVAVYTQPDSPAGRGRPLAISPIKKAAISWELPVVQPVNFKKAEAVEQLADCHPDVIVVAAFGQILPQSVLDIPAHGCINIHPSLLPKFRGASPVVAAILAGSAFTGVSIMLLDRGMDTGPVLARAQIAISERDTTGSLAVKLSRVAAPLLLEVLSGWLKGELTPRPQDETEATYTSVLSKSEGEIDWRLPAVDIWRRVRAFQPWPGCYTRWQGKQLKIIEAVPLTEEAGLEIGQVVALDKGETAFGVNTGKGILGILAVQLEGKRAMPAAEFLRGQRQIIGAILGGSESPR
ncbi:MAG: methionyl-tRNA formyltransferase [Chloroflexi bacterium]|nr:methionyl-tRNA formyltransferase [Chloroflexota bacterium]